MAIARRRTVKWGLIAVSAIAVVGWLARASITGWRFDWRAFGAALSALNWWWLAAAAAWVMAGYYARALRWRILMRPVKAAPRLWNLFSATVIGFSAMTILGRPGEFVRPYLVATKERVPVSSQLAALVLERIYDLLLVLAIFGSALGRVRRSGMSLGPALSWVLAMGGWLVGGLAVAILLVLAIFRQFAAGMQRRLLAWIEPHAKPHHLQTIERLATAFVQGVESTRSRSGVLLAIWYSILTWITIALTAFCVVRAFGGGLHLGFLDVLIFLGFLAFGAVVQIPGVGGGVQVVTVLVLTEMFRVPVELSTSVALVLWFVSFVVVVPIGAALALHDGIRWRTLRETPQLEVGQ